MILLNGKKVTPTIFPDGTSQVWNVSGIDSEINQVTWYFEEEREIIDLCSLVQLLPKGSYKSLKMPYLPYARQDKLISNDSTFNLAILSGTVNSLEFNLVSAFDVHNPELTKKLIKNFVNINPRDAIDQIVVEFKPDYQAYPDNGACGRYNNSSIAKKVIIGEKLRNQTTGQIEKYEINAYKGFAQTEIRPNSRILIVDDICDGGATFISMAKEILKAQPKIDEIALYVSHGLFTKGRQHLLDNGIDKIYTTNSLLRNPEGIKV